MIGLINFQSSIRSPDLLGKRRFGYKSSKLGMEKVAMGITQLKGSLDERQYIFYWVTILSTYVRCSLTKSSDKLIALSGIAKAFREVTGGTYLAGLWKDWLHYGLLWKTTPTSGSWIQRNESYAPSWSWASVTSTGTGADVELETHEWMDDVVSLIRLVDERIVTEPPGGDVTGLLRSAELDIECRLLYFRASKKSSSWLDLSWSFNVYADEGKTECYIRSNSTKLFFDMSDRQESCEEKYEVEGTCIPLCTKRVGSGIDFDTKLLYYLILEVAGDGRFQRSGIIQSIFDSRGRSHPPNPQQDRWGGWNINNWAGVSSLITLV